MIYITGKSGIYHRETCMYVNRMKEENRKTIHLRYNKKEGIEFCKYCCSFNKVLEEQRIKNKAYMKEKRVMVMKANDYAYVKTDNQAWKIEFDKEEQYFLLYRQVDHFEDIHKLKNGEYERWEDTPPTRDLTRIISDIALIEKEMKNWNDYYSKFDEVQKAAESKRMKVDLDKEKIYVRTQCGCWYMRFDVVSRQYSLFHMNRKCENISLEEAKEEAYHRQVDKKYFLSATAALDYIYAHDNALSVSSGDYHRLPKESRKQKSYYKKAKKKAAYKSIQRTKDLFEQIEKGTDYKALSVW